MANKKITDLVLRSSVTDDVNIPGDDGVQTYRVTALQIKQYVLSLLAISNGMLQDNSVTTSKINAGAVTDAKTAFTPPTVQRFTSGSGTYTTPAGVKYIKVKMIGGGAGGNGNANANSSSGGGNSSFGTSLLTAGGASGGPGGAGGTNTINSPAIALVNVAGAIGGVYTNLASSSGGYGGSTAMGGGAPGGFGGGGGGATGTSAKANSGAGGGGGGAAGTGTSSGGGSTGGYLEAIITNPGANYSYSVGVGGSAGTAGTAGAGGTGGSGVIIVEEYYV